MARRSRFTVTLSSGGKQVILAYSALGARQYYEKLGHTVAGVKAGDYRMEKPAGSAAGFKLIEKRVEEAKKELGLTWPVAIRFNSRQGATRGNYLCEGTDEAPRHKIMLKSYLTPEAATFVLLHELRHAWQAEQKGSKSAWDTYRRDQRRYSYRQRPIEMDANSYARMKEATLLASL